MKKAKQFYYVIVCIDGKLKFVTSVDTNTKSCKWEMKKGEKPYKFYSWDDANYLCLGLACNMQIWAYPVTNSYELDTLPYYEKDDKKEE